MVRYSPLIIDDRRGLLGRKFITSEHSSDSNTNLNELDKNFLFCLKSISLLKTGICAHFIKSLSKRMIAVYNILDKEKINYSHGGVKTKFAITSEWNGNFNIELLKIVLGFYYENVLIQKQIIVNIDYSNPSKKLYINSAENQAIMNELENPKNIEDIFGSDEKITLKISYV